MRPPRGQSKRLSIASGPARGCCCTGQRGAVIVRTPRRGRRKRPQLVRPRFLVDHRASEQTHAMSGAAVMLWTWAVICERKPIDPPECSGVPRRGAPARSSLWETQGEDRGPCPRCRILGAKRSKQDNVRRARPCAARKRQRGAHKGAQRLKLVDGPQGSKCCNCAAGPRRTND
jgi:hypothetical protein